MSHHPHRLARDHYRGRFTHFVTACTYRRHETFADRVAALAVADQYLRACRKHGFEDIAHTLMPDHVHALIRGTRTDSDFVKWIDLWRQLAGYWWKRRRNADPIWQEGYWDYTLRDDESVPAIASYIVWNPVVAGLAAKPEDYAYTGSERFSIAELASIPPLKPRCGDL